MPDKAAPSSPFYFQDVQKDPGKNKSTDAGAFTNQVKSPDIQISIPRIDLPKGGGALKGIDEKFEVNAANGTASFSLPLPISPGRNGFQPGLSLDYNSGGGNGVFGLGWDLTLTAIQRRTDKQLPRYRDEEDSDTFMFSGAEDLVPFLIARCPDADSSHEAGAAHGDGPAIPSGDWRPEITRTGGCVIQRYRPRIEGGFSRIEKVLHPQKGTYWKVTARDNTTTIYGDSPSSRIADPGNPDRIFKWLPSFSYNDKGNCMRFRYKAEDTVNVPSVLPEKNRLNGKAKFTNRYLESIQYGNQSPYYVKADCQDPPPLPGRYFFELVFDYGERDLSDPSVEAPHGSSWNSRVDPFSGYHAGFEIRTYRLCRHILMFHHFSELGTTPTLIHSLDLHYRDSLSRHPEQPLEMTFLVSATQTSYVRKGETSPHEGLAPGKYLSKSLPPMEFGYQDLKWDTTIKEISPDNIANAPVGLGNNYNWVDLYGEGISGILTEQADAWYYKRNKGDGKFTTGISVAPKPSFTGLAAGTLRLMDLNADGSRQMVNMQNGVRGYFNLDDDNNWHTFRPFATMPSIDFDDPWLRMIDLNGDGKPDLLITEENIFRWYPSLGTNGYASLEIVGLDLDEENSPRIVFADPGQTIFLANMSGDGLTDIVRIRNGSVCYWPNLGYGRFGPKVSMAGAPWFDHPDLFNPDYLHLADISGTGATDLLYLGRDGFRAWLNLSGNAWSRACEIDPFLSTALPDNITVVDLLGNGTSCIVWSSPLAYNAETPLKYIDLMSGRKPHIMNFYTNHCGKETRLTYASSTRFYLEDERNGHPWVTRLPFPVQCVSKKEVWEKVTHTYFVNEYSYHHGYYDHPEREYRGFGRVDQTDTQRFDSGQPDHTEGPAPHSYSNHTDRELNEPPVLTKTWFHVGAYLQDKKILDHFQHEYWYNNPSVTRQYDGRIQEEYPLPDALFVGQLNAQELREAHRACKGMTLRQEVFALDDSGKDALPYTVTTHNCYVRKLQPLEKNKYAVFLVQESESISFSYERKPEDPRIAHRLNIRFDELGNVLTAASVVYPRRHRPEGLDDETIWKAQTTRHIVLNENSFTNDFITPGTYRLRQPYQVKTFELHGLPLPRGKEYYTIPILEKAAVASVIDYGKNFTEDALQKRWVAHIKTLYLGDGLAGPLPGGKLDSLALVYETYQQVFTTGLVDALYRRNGHPLIPDIPAALHDGKYTDPEKDGHWWIRSGRLIYEDETLTRAMFFMPRAYEDPFGARTTVEYYKEHLPEADRYNLLVEATIDALGNKVKVERFNFRNLSPELTRDINDNLSEVLFDERAMVVATAIRGKKDEAAGDLIDDTVNPYLSAEEVRSFFEDPFSKDGDRYEKGRSLLGHASSRLLYDYSSIPVRTATIVRETHVSDLSPGEKTRIQFSFEYTGGMGNLVLKKTQTSPDQAAPRWIGTGRTVLNNKGKPVRQYEPYFSSTHRCEKEDLLVKHGVTPLIHYDPVGRVIRTDQPDGTFTASHFDNWKEDTFDANDTVIQSRWYKERIDGTYDRQGKDPALEKEAAEKTAVHAGTFSTSHLDNLGRAIAVATRNKWQATPLLHPGQQIDITRKELDIRGNILQVTDARHNITIQYKYDMPGRLLYQASADAGERWLLHDCLGNPDYAWDSRGQRFHMSYDLLRRPIASKVDTRYDSPAASKEDAEKRSPKEIVFSRSFYGGNDKESVAVNLNGQVIAQYDSAGLSNTLRVDFKGNVVTSSRRLCRQYKVTPDWSGATATDPVLPLEPETWLSDTKYDALNRPIKVYAPHTEPDKANILFPSYNEASQLRTLSVALRAAAPHTLFIRNIQYDEKGRRTKIIYGNDTTTSYKYDKETFRLLKLETKAKDAPHGQWLQALSYTYDAAGNIIHIDDKAWQPVWFRNKVVNPSNDYTYDALYRLIAATGREFAAQDHPITEYDGERRRSSAIPFRNAAEMQSYIQSYAYDEVGNMLKILHRAHDSGGWTKEFKYGDDNNRLSGTKIVADPSWEEYRYDPHGNMQNLDAIRDMYWDFKDQLSYIGVAASGEQQEPEQQAWYVYDNSGQRIRKIVEKGAGTEERIYLGSVEIYREYTTAGIDPGKKFKERETLHVTDDTGRIALVETLTMATQPQTMTAQPQTTTAAEPLIRYQYSNHLESSSLELDEKGQVISYEEYYPYGSTSFELKNKAVDAARKRYRYTGKERDEESGLYYHGSRYYAPWLARWTAADPTGIKGGLNLYVFAADNPIVYTDRTGNAPTTPPTNSIEDLFTFIRNQAAFETGAEKGISFARGAASPFGTATHTTATDVVAAIKAVGFKNADQIYSEVRTVAGVVTQIAGKPGGPKGSFNLDLVAVKEGETLSVGSKLDSAIGELIGDIKIGGGVIAKKYEALGIPLKTVNGKTAASTTEEVADLVNATKAAEDAANLTKVASVGGEGVSILSRVGGIGLKALGPLGAGLSAYSLGQDYAKGDAAAGLADLAGTVSGGLQTFALASNALSALGVGGGAAAGGGTAVATGGVATVVGETAVVGGGTVVGGGAAALAAEGAAVVGAFAVGATIGIGIQEGSAYVSKKYLGTEISPGQIIGDTLTVQDQAISSLFADPNKPAYTQTLGWKLAGWLTPTSN